MRRQILSERDERMDIATDLLTLVNDLKSAAYDEQIYILQTLGGKLINDCHIDAFGVTIAYTSSTGAAGRAAPAHSLSPVMK